MRLQELLVCTLCLSSCASIEPLSPDPFESGEREASLTLEPSPVEVGEEIVVCGERFSCGAPVVLWSDPGGYDAYDVALRAGTNPDYRDKSSGRRYRPGRRAQLERGIPRVSGSSESVALLGGAVDQIVLHFDVCGLSRTCFDVLHNQRGLSAHFLLDIDGTIYQTLDLRETAWHATKANDRSIGIEIAQIGARKPAESAEFEEWYSIDELGTYIDIPRRLGDGGVRTSPFRGRPASLGLVEGRINGTRLVQYDFTHEQYESLTRLVSTLMDVLPRIERTVPVNELGEVPMGRLTDEDYESFRGVLGHYHVQDNKLDPGPAFDWDRLMSRLRLLELESSIDDERRPGPP